MNCNERNYGLIVSITAYADSDITWNVPMARFKKYVTADDLKINENAKPIHILVKPGSANLEESSKDSLQGTEYTINLTWESEPMNANEYEKLQELKRVFKHLIVNTFGDNDLFIHANEDGWAFAMDDTEGTMKCKLSVMNEAGVRRFA